MPIQALIRWLLPKDDRFFKLFEDHAEVISEAAKIMLDFPATDGGNIHGVLTRIHQLEHRGDDMVRSVMLAQGEFAAFLRAKVSASSAQPPARTAPTSARS